MDQSGEHFVPTPCRPQATGFPPGRVRAEGQWHSVGEARALSQLDLINSLTYFLICKMGQNTTAQNITILVSALPQPATACCSVSTVIPSPPKEKKNILQAHKVLFLSSLQNVSQLNPILQMLGPMQRPASPTLHLSLVSPPLDLALPPSNPGFSTNSQGRTRGVGQIDTESTQVRLPSQLFYLTTRSQQS